jgi:hypothetical protein
MNEVILSNKQMTKLVEIHKAFPNISFYSIRETHESGIGPTMRVYINLFDVDSDEPDTQIDITDLELW